MKTTKKITTSIAVLFLLTGFRLYSQEFRGGMGLEYSFDKLSIDAEFDSRHISANDLEKKYIGEVKFTYPVLEHISLSGSFRYLTKTEREFEEGTSNIETSEKNRFAFDVRYNSERFKNDLKIKNRLRYQFTLDGEEMDNTSLREKICFDYKMSKLYSPYVAGEIYYNPEDERIKAYRIYLGNTVEIREMEVDLFYIIEKKTKKVNSGTYYILGLALKYRI